MVSFTNLILTNIFLHKLFETNTAAWWFLQEELVTKNK